MNIKKLLVLFIPLLIGSIFLGGCNLFKKKSGISRNQVYNKLIEDLDFATANKMINFFIENNYLYTKTSGKANINVNMYNTSKINGTFSFLTTGYIVSGNNLINNSISGQINIQFPNISIKGSGDLEFKLLTTAQKLFLNLENLKINTNDEKIDNQIQAYMNILNFYKNKRLYIDLQNLNQNNNINVSSISKNIFKLEAKLIKDIKTFPLLKPINSQRKENYTIFTLNIDKNNLIKIVSDILNSQEFKNLIPTVKDKDIQDIINSIRKSDLSKKYFTAKVYDIHNFEIDFGSYNVDEKNKFSIKLVVKNDLPMLKLTFFENNKQVGYLILKKDNDKNYLFKIYITDNTTNSSLNGNISLIISSLSDKKIGFITILSGSIQSNLLNFKLFFNQSSNYISTGVYQISIPQKAINLEQIITSFIMGGMMNNNNIEK